MAIKMFPPGMNTLSHRSQPPSEILFFRVYDWQVTFERKAHKHCYSATLHLIYKEVTRWSLPESAFPQRPLRLCQVNHCNVSGIVLSLAANMFQKMACRGGMVPTLALQFCSSTICVVWQNPLFLSFFFFPFHEKHALFKHSLAAMNKKVSVKFYNLQNTYQPSWSSGSFSP